ncbi:hypothetical protein ACS3SW_04785 [Roseobacteraceae bacterium S113]
MKQVFGVLTILALYPLSGCGVAAVTAADVNDGAFVGATRIEFPAKMLLVDSDGSQLVYSGTMQGHVSGAADFDLKSVAGAPCSGRIEASGALSMTCDGIGISGQYPPPKRAFSGVHYTRVPVGSDVFESVFAWGKGVSEPVMRRALAERRSITGAEARKIAAEG